MNNLIAYKQTILLALIEAQTRFYDAINELPHDSIKAKSRLNTVELLEKEIDDVNSKIKLEPEQCQ